jgi:hypothetical protein
LVSAKYVSIIVKTEEYSSGHCYLLCLQIEYNIHTELVNGSKKLYIVLVDLDKHYI